MRLFAKRLLGVFFLVLSAAEGADAQTDTAFWFAAPEISQYGTANLDRPITVRLTAGTQAATVTISQPAGGGLPTQTVVIAAGATQSVDLTNWITSIENTPANTILNLGLKITSTTPITAYYEVISGLNQTCDCNPEIFTLKGRNALGTDFWIPSQNLVPNSPSYFPTPYQKFDIVATQNGTTVTITPSAAVVGHPAGTPYTVTLNAGQTYSATATSQAANQHLGGSKVTSDKPIAITMTDDLIAAASVWGGGCVDMVGDQIVPTNIIGTEYIATNGSLNAPYDRLFVTATANGTTVSRNGTVLATIAAGQTYMFDIGGPTCYIQTSQPAYVFQLSGVGCELGGALLPAIVCTGSSSVSFARSSPNILDVTLLVKNGGQGAFQVNGSATVVTAANFTAVPGTGGQWYAAKVNLPLANYPANTVVKVTNSTNLFHLGVLDGSQSGGARFGYFSNYGGVSPGIRHSPPCVGSPLQLFTDPIAGATYAWTGPNGFTSNLQNPVVSTSATTGLSGTYTLTVTSSGCNGSTSANIIVRPLPVITVTPPRDTICPPESVTLTASGAATYEWSPPTALNTTTGPTVVSTPTATVTYTITGTDSVGCKGTGTATILVGSGSVRDVAAMLCSGAAYTFGSQVLTQPGVYTETFQTAAGCDSAVRLTLSTVASPSAAFDYAPSPPVPNQPIQFTNRSVGATAYQWAFGDGASSTLTNPSYLFPISGSYSVCLVAYNAQCADTVCRNLFADVTPIADVPKAFSPNGDGRNDVLYVRGAGIATMSLRVFNRWGKLVFESTSLEKGWDGTMDGKKQEMDGYAYILQVTFVNGTTFNKSGNVTLIR